MTTIPNLIPRALYKISKSSFVCDLRHTISRVLLRTKPLELENFDVTVIIPVNNRFGFRLKNCLNSIRLQEYTLGRIQIIVVNSGDDNNGELSDLMKEGFIDKILECPIDTWNKPKLTNFGVKQVESEFLVLCDSDIIFSSNYFQVAVNKIQQDKLSFITCECRELAEEHLSDFRTKPLYDEWMKASTLRKAARGKWLHWGKITYGVGIIFLRTVHFSLVGGLDTRFEGYGFEDLDFYYRIKWLGLNENPISEKSFYLHQSHQRETKRSKKQAESLEINRTLFFKSWTIKRNSPKFE